MSNFNDLYDHVAADRSRAMQLLGIQDIRRKAVAELLAAGAYTEPDNIDNMTDAEREQHKAEAAYGLGRPHILEAAKMPVQDGDEAYAIADMMLERLNLKRFAPANPFTLSGGEKRRLSVASMLAAAPKVLVMDEPTFGQDFTTWTEMVRLIAGARDAGCSVIMVTHDEPLIEALGARRILVSEGE